MGDRGNIVIDYKNDADDDIQPQIFFYTHWSGYRLPFIVAAGLIESEDRWDDPAYMNRILFQTLLDGDEGSTGFGIDTQMGDGGTEVYINPILQRVKFNDEVYSYEDFISAFEEKD